MQVRPARPEDMAGLLGVERAAFGGPVEADLVTALLADPSAAPFVNLIAEHDGEIVGHVLFTRAVVESAAGDVDASILAPLAVAPAAQGCGIGQALGREGIAHARTVGAGLVFVLGSPGYYPRLGFGPALPQGLEPPYPLAPADSDAWMVIPTRPGLLGEVRGKVRCADSLMRPELWAE